MSNNPIQHQHTKHIEIDLLYVRERVALGDIKVLHIPTTSQFTDIFTKGLPISIFSKFWSSLNVSLAVLMLLLRGHVRQRGMTTSRTVVWFLLSGLPPIG
jgi:hypothetical protein